MTWQTKYSSAEMAFLETGGSDVVYYIDIPRNVEGRWSFEEVLAGVADYDLNGVFGPAVVEELKAEARSRIREAGDEPRA